MELWFQENTVQMAVGCEDEVVGSLVRTELGMLTIDYRFIIDTSLLD